MSTQLESQSVVEVARKAGASQTVEIKSTKTGVLPMERRLPDGSKNISSCEYTPQGKMINVKHVRPLNFGIDGVEKLNPEDPDDLAHIEEAKAWIEDGTDPRIRLHSVEIVEGGSTASHPIGLIAEKMKPDALILRMTEDVNYLADDEAAVRNYLERAARHELQRVDGRGKAIRQKVLDAIDELGVASGIEYGTDEVGEE